MNTLNMAIWAGRNFQCLAWDMAKKTGIRITKADTARLRQLAQESPRKIEAALDVVVEEIVTDIKLGMQESPPGENQYKRGGKTHTASQPGKPPRPDFGALMGSIHWEKTGKFSRRIADGVEYGYSLEVGKEHIAARPFMDPVFEDWRGKFARTIKKELRF